MALDTIALVPASLTFHTYLDLQLLERRLLGAERALGLVLRVLVLNEQQQLGAHARLLHLLGLGRCRAGLARARHGYCLAVSGRRGGRRRGPVEALAFVDFGGDQFVARLRGRGNREWSTDGQTHVVSSE